jgi:hypothetical protein
VEAPSACRVRGAAYQATGPEGQKAADDPVEIRSVPIDAEDAKTISAYLKKNYGV